MSLTKLTAAALLATFGLTLAASADLPPGLHQDRCDVRDGH
jgi:hypothetical protein